MKYVFLLIGLVCLLTPAFAQNADELFKDYQVPDTLPLQHRIELMGHLKQYTWKDLDTLYRAEVAQSGSRDLKNLVYIFMVCTKNMIDEADKATLQYYADELAAIYFNINLNTIVVLIEKLTPTWGKATTARYALNMYEKNRLYAEEGLMDATQYLQSNQEAFDDLKRIAEQKQD